VRVLPVVDQPQRQRLYALLGRVQFFQTLVQTPFGEAGHGRRTSGPPFAAVRPSTTQRRQRQSVVTNAIAANTP